MCHVFVEIKVMGCTGGRSMLRYYIQPKRKMRPSKRTVRFETQPGCQLQHDWGENRLASGSPRKGTQAQGYFFSGCCQSFC